jgi:hypothetical protein
MAARVKLVFLTLHGNTRVVLCVKQHVSAAVPAVGRVVRLPRATGSKLTEKMGSKMNSVDLKKVNFWPNNKLSRSKVSN